MGGIMAAHTVSKRFMILLGFITIVPWLLMAQFSGGSGTDADPYWVVSVQDLNEVRNYPTATFKQMANIDLDVAPYNQGTGWEPIGTSIIAFTGKFNGSGYSISNMYINTPQLDNRGLFGQLNNAVMENITIDNGSIYGRSRSGLLAGSSSGSQITRCNVMGQVHGYLDVGGIVGALLAEGLMIDCSSQVRIHAYTYIGGLVGWAQNSTIRTSKASGFISGSKVMGGLVGDLSSSIVLKCYANMELSGTLGLAGGLAGWTLGNSQIEYSYAKGRINTTTTKGGICGRLSQASRIFQCYAVVLFFGTNNAGIVANADAGSVLESYYNSDLLPLSINTIGEGRSTAQMTYSYDQTTYVGWDFVNVWAHDDSFSINDGYPILAPEYVDAEEALLPPSNLCLSSYPNPFARETNIRINVSKNCMVSAKIFNLKGQMVREIPPFMATKGESTFTWDGTDKAQNPVAKGIYYVQVKSDRQYRIHKLIKY